MNTFLSLFLSEWNVSCGKGISTSQSLIISLEKTPAHPESPHKKRRGRT